MRKNPVCVIKKVRRAFTLLEIMVVLIIIGILAAVVAPKVTAYLDDAKITSAKSEIGTLTTALNSYYSVNGEYPSSLRVIAEKYLDKAKFNDNKQLLDPWGVPYQYTVKDAGGKKRQSFQIICAGPDNIIGTKDDITQAGGSKLGEGGLQDEFDESLEGELLEENLE